MFSELLLAAAFQVGPFYEQAQDACAVRPFYAETPTQTDFVWPVFTQHRDWWRFCLLAHYQQAPKDGYQFSILPIWWNGRETLPTEETRHYWGLFPLVGSHPNLFFLYDFKFVCWPLWMSYQMPRPSENRWLTTQAVLWPFIHWREDGSWGFWPFYVCNHQRESDHRTVLWPLVTWASHRSDRDTAGAGSSWMVWPLWAQVTRERESQWMCLPPLFASSRTNNGSRLRLLWPIFEHEDVPASETWRFFPLYERVVWRSFATREETGSVSRFGWKLAEFYDDETRVFPFWVSRSDDTYFRFWPFVEVARNTPDVTRGRVLALFPIRWVPAIDRNWAKFWTFYEWERTPVSTDHALFWGLIRWRTRND